MANLDVELLQRRLNRELTPEEQSDIDLWEKGRALAHVVNMQGWDVILEMLQSYALEQIQILANTDPTDKDKVLAAHAVFFAASRIFECFKEDVQKAIDVSRNPPPVIVKEIRKATGSPSDDLI